MNHLTTEQTNELRKLNDINVSWRDYALLLVNSTAEPLRSIWRDKIVTSVCHWKFNSGSISEGNIVGIEVLEALPNELTESMVDDHFDRGNWYKMNRLNGSKRMNVFVGHYPQESISNEANLCLKSILSHWDEVYEEQTMKTYGTLVTESPYLSSIWKLAQMGDGACVTPDEVLTYLLERAVDDSRTSGAFMKCCLDVLSSGRPSDKYKKYWKTDMVKGFPLHVHEICKESVDSIMSELRDIPGNPSDANFSLSRWYELANRLFDQYECDLPIEEQKKNFMMFIDTILKEDVSMSPCWKKICICILKNDVSFKYAGFGPTMRERQAREEAIAAFDTKQEEREKAKAEAKRLAEQSKKENKR